MNNLKKTFLTGTVAAVFALALLMSPGKASASDSYDGHSNYGGHGYGGGLGVLLIPSVDYFKSAFMQNFSYYNDTSYANKTAINYATTQANESYAQGFGNFDFGSRYGGSQQNAFGVNALFGWLAGLLGGHFGGNVSMHY